MTVLVDLTLKVTIYAVNIPKGIVIKVLRFIEDLIGCIMVELRVNPEISLETGEYIKVDYSWYKKHKRNLILIEDMDLVKDLDKLYKAYMVEKFGRPKSIGFQEIVALVDNNPNQAFNDSIRAELALGE